MLFKIKCAVAETRDTYQKALGSWCHKTDHKFQALPELQDKFESNLGSLVRPCLKNRQ